MSRLRIFAYLLILLAVFVAGSSCAGGGNRGTSSPSMESIALDSGLDKKSMSDDINEYAGSDEYASRYRDQAGAGGSAYSLSAEQQDELADNGWNNPYSPGTTDDGSDTDIPANGILTTIDDWLNPKAWAQEGGMDESFIIRTGNIEMEIDDYDKSSAEVRTITQRHGGIITDSNMQKYGDDMRVGWITLRVPSDKFQQCFEDLKAIGEVKVQSVSSEDVTNEYIAGVSRMQALQTEHKTLQGMLEDAREIQRSRGLGEAYSVLLDTQKRLSQVTTELQTVENRVSALRDRINRSTITINLSERPLAPPPDEFSWGFGSTFENAKKDLMSGVAYTVNVLIYWLVNGLVWWLIWIGIIWLAWVLFLKRLWNSFKKAALAKGEEPVAQ